MPLALPKFTPMLLRSCFFRSGVICLYASADFCTSYLTLSFCSGIVLRALAATFLARAPTQVRQLRLLGDEHLTADDTLPEGWTSLKSSEDSFAPSAGCETRDGETTRSGRRPRSRMAATGGFTTPPAAAVVTAMAPENAGRYGLVVVVPWGNACHFPLAF
jgi:hypothetical protein